MDLQFSKVNRPKDIKCQIIPCIIIDIIGGQGKYDKMGKIIKQLLLT